MNELLMNRIAKYAIVTVLMSIMPYDICSQTLVDYVWPIQDEKEYGRFITSAFGEHRPDRFHAGIDIKTIWQEGHKVIAVEDGSLYRLRIGPNGYGRAIYLRLKNGNIAVYGHLRQFEKNIQVLAEEEQRNAGKYTVDLWYSPGAVPVSKGDILGTTGRSGTRLQHLHFELRDRNNVPLNPIQQGLLDDDKMPPRPTKLSLRPMNMHSTVEGDWRPHIVRLNGFRNDAYIIEKPIRVMGKVGIAVDVYDRNGTYDNNYGIYSLTLQVNGFEVYKARYEQFSFNQNRLINLDRDYRLMRRNKGRFQKLYKDIENSLSFYGNYTAGDGIIDLHKSQSETVPFEITIADYSGNLTYVRGELERNDYMPDVVFPMSKTDAVGTNETASELSNDQTPLKPARQFSIYEDYQDDFLRIVLTANRNQLRHPAVNLRKNEGTRIEFPVKPFSKRKFVAIIPLSEVEFDESLNIMGESSDYQFRGEIPLQLVKIPHNGGTHDFEDSIGSITFPENGLYNDIWLRASREGGTVIQDRYPIAGSIIHMEPKELFLKSSAKIDINVSGTPFRKDKLALYAQSEDGRWHYIGRDRNLMDGTVSTSLSSLETVAVILDTIPPNIWRIRPRNDSSTTSTRPEIAAWFDDELSGVQSEDDLEMYVDSDKVIAEWDPIRNKIFFLPREPLGSGSHTVLFRAADRMGNSSERSWNFMVE